MRMVKREKKRLPYSERTDLQKIQSNWKKIKRLCEEEEWSSAVMRAAISCEIAINLMIREELSNKCHLKIEFVNSILKWANGLQGKIDRIIVPLSKGTDPLLSDEEKSRLTQINKERNSVVHYGYFKKKSTAKKSIKQSKVTIEAIINRYYTEFELENIYSDL